MIISFYSYKGGVGRSQILVNLGACLCYEYSKKVLLMDWDLEAPGLPYFFPNKRDTTKKGMIDLLTAYMEFVKNDGDAADLPTLDANYIQSVHENVENTTQLPHYALDVVSAGHETDYLQTLSAINWDTFYDTYNGKDYIEWLKGDLLQRYDYILIDSRTGMSEYSGIPNIQFPDLNIFIIAPTEQNFTGALQVAKYIQQSDYVQKKYRENWILPILSRIDPFLIEKLKDWSNDFKNRFQPFFENVFKALRKPMNTLDAFIEDSSLYYTSQLAYGENVVFPVKGKGSPLKTFEDKVKTVAELVETLRNPNFDKIRYAQIRGGGNVYIGSSVMMTVERDLNQCVLCLSIDSAEPSTKIYTIQIYLKAQKVLGNKPIPLLAQPQILYLSDKVVEAIRIYRTQSKYADSKEDLAKSIFNNIFKAELLTICQDFIFLLEQASIGTLTLVLCSDAPQIQQIPFELVMGKFFSGNKLSFTPVQFGFARAFEAQLMGFKTQSKVALPAPLKLLFASVSPQFRLLEREQKHLRKAAEGNIQTDILIEYLDVAALSAIKNALAKRQHDILHVSGLSLDMQNETLMMEDDSGAPKIESVQDWSNTLRQYSNLKLLILSGFNHFVLPPSFLYAECPAIIVLPKEMSEEGTHFFTTVLYTTLKLGKSLTIAIASARQEMEERYPNHWFLPTVYMSQYADAFVNTTLPYQLPTGFYAQRSIFNNPTQLGIGEGFIGRKRDWIKMRHGFEQGKHLFLYGMAGIGKTTLATVFAQHYDNCSHNVLFFNSFKISESYILNVLNKVLKQANPTDDPFFSSAMYHSEHNHLDQVRLLLTNYVKRYKMILIFDGLDEISLPFKPNDKAILDFLIYLSENSPEHCRLIFTSRYQIPSLAPVVEFIQMDGWDAAEQHRYYKNSEKFGKLSLTEWQKIAQKLNGNPRGYIRLERRFTVAYLDGLLQDVEKQLLSTTFWAKNMGRLNATERTNFLLMTLFVDATPISVLSDLTEKPISFLIPIVQSLHDKACCYYDAARLTFSVNQLWYEWMVKNSDYQETLKKWALKAGYYFKQKRDEDSLKRAIVCYERAADWVSFAETSFLLQDIYQLSGLHAQAIALNQAVLVKDIPERWISIALSNLGMGLKLQGQLEIAFSYYEESLAIKRKIGDKAGESALLNNISQIYESKGDYKKTLHYLEQSLMINREIQDLKGEGSNLNNLATLAYAQGDYDKALAYLEQSLVIQKEIKHLPTEGAVLNNISQIHHIRGDYDQALDYLERSLAIRRAIKDRQGEAMTLNNLSYIQTIKGDDVAALAYLERSLQIQQEIGDLKGEGITLNNSGQLYAEKGDYDTALRYFERSLAIAHEVGDRQNEATTYSNLATCMQSKGDFDKALSYLETSLMIQRTINDRQGEGITLNHISRIYEVRGDLETALSMLHESLMIARKIGDRRNEGSALNNLGQIYQKKQEYDAALSYLKESRLIYEKIGDKAGLAIALSNEGSIYLKTQQAIEKTVFLLVRAYKIFKELKHPHQEHTNRQLLDIVAQIGEIAFRAIVEKIPE